LGLSSSVVYYGENITVTGSIPLGGTNVTLTYTIVNSSAFNSTLLDYATANDTILNYTSNDSAVSRLASTDSSGFFSDAYSLNQTGTWIVWASWNGSKTYFDAHSGYRNFTVQKVPMSITCNVTSKSVTIGDNITVTGSVYPIVANLTVNVIFTAANTTIEQTAYTNSNGTFYVSWKPDSMELWQVHANLAGNASISVASSNVGIFTVNDTFLNQYLFIIIGVIGGVAGVSVVVFIIRRRRYE